MEHLAVGALIDGRYCIRRVIAHGGMCGVYCATHEFTDRQVALKLLDPEHDADERDRKRLLREARALELARSRYVVDVLDAGLTAGGSPYLAMEMLEGRSLQGILAARQRLRIADAVAIGVQVCRALSSAHARGVVHRDVKPGNIMIASHAHGEVTAKLIDFGIAAIASSADSPASPVARKDRITRAGEFFGTPEYLAPECMHKFETVDRRSDLYSLGVTLYECLTGGVPHAGTFGEVLMKTLTSHPPDVRTGRVDVPPVLAECLLRAMSVHPPDRFQDATEMEAALALALQHGQETTVDGALAKPAPSRPPEDRAFLEPEPAVVQRRRFPRAPFVTPVRIELADGTIVSARSEDISEGGLLVLAASPCGNDVQAVVRFMTPLAGRVVDVRVLARWVKTARGKAAIGLEFLDLSADLRLEIAEYVGLASREG